MSQTLYRKYRSQRFAEIIGQAPVVKILRNSIALGRLNHAYLFAGPRGTGKTSIARIFAKALNCLNPQDGDACGVCDICRSIAAGNAVDVIEIDAASNRGIDDIRDLRERVNYAPLELQRKVYIIDEVHMITGPAWNALLKTLEEPPGHVIFCLCTTEANKVPVTILSRCIRFDFQRLPLPELAAHLEYIAQAECFTLEAGAALKLAQLAEGSARDAISLLDQLTVFCESTIALRDIDELFQLGDPALIQHVATSVLTGDTGSALEAWSGMLARGVDASSFLLQLSEELKQRYLTESLSQTSAALEAVWQGLNLLKYDSFPALLVELTLIQAAGARASSGTLTSAPPRQPQVSSTPAPRPAERPQAQPVSPRDIQPVVGGVSREGESVSSASPQVLPNSVQDAGGENLLASFREKVHVASTAASSLLLGAKTAYLDGNCLVISYPEAQIQKQTIIWTKNSRAMSTLRETAKRLFGQHTVIELRREGESSAAGPAPPAQTNGTGAVEIEAPVAPAAVVETLAAVAPAAEALESRPKPEDRAATIEDVERLFPSGMEETQ